MEQTEKRILESINQIFDDLDAATYGKERNNGHFLPPDASIFYHRVKRLYDLVDELVDNYQPDYITGFDYRFINDSQRTLLPDLAVFQERNKLKGEQLTWELEKYLLRIEELFGCVLKNSRK